MFNTFFPKIAPFMTMSKNVKTKGPQTTSQYGAYALHAGFARLNARMHMHTQTNK
jgi:hypothetical protein